MRKRNSNALKRFQFRRGPGQGGMVVGEPVPAAGVPGLPKALRGLLKECMYEYEPGGCRGFAACSLSDGDGVLGRIGRFK